MPATESLTIEILGDSSGLSQALDDALSRVESLQSAADSASTSAGGIGGRLASVSSSLQPLQLVGQQLNRISQQAQAIGQQPISLNVQPALSALQSLMSAIQAVAAQLSILSNTGGGPRGGLSGSPGGTVGPSPGASPRFNLTSRAISPQSLAVSPRLVAPPTVARLVPPLITSAGTSTYDLVNRISTPQQPLAEPSPERRSRGVTDVMQLPIRELFMSHQNSPSLSRTPESRSAMNTPTAFHSNESSLDRSMQLDHSSSTVNHFGGITIEVRETADVNELVRDLRLQGLSTRHRQG